MAEQLDTIFTILGTGCWNWLHYIAVGLALFLPPSHIFAGAFVTPPLKFWCLNPSGEDDVFRNDSSWDSCRYYNSSGDENPQGISCEEWGFDNSTFTNTITSEFELICQKDYLRATYQSVYMIGIFVGSPFNGVFADRHGRKATLVCGCLTFTVMAILSCWLPDFTSILIARFFLGTTSTPLLRTGYILSMEISNPKVRSLVGISMFFPWALAIMAWGGLAYMIRDWRIMLAVSSTPCIILLPLLWYLDESPRWLVVNGQHERALQTLKRAARWNKVTLPSDQAIIALMMKEYSRSYKKLSIVQENVENKQTYATILKNYVNGALILIRTPRLRLVTLVTHIQTWCLILVYFSLNLSGNNFSFDIFFYMAMMGLMEIPSYTIMAPITSRFGRRIPIATFSFISGISLLIEPFLPSGHQWLIITCTMIGKMSISMANQGTNLFASELFPTEVRTRGISSTFMMSTVGTIIAPFINDYLVLLYPWAPLVVFGLAAAVAGFATLILWETLGMALPDTIAQLESPDFQTSMRCSRKTEPAPDADLKDREVNA